MVETRKDQIKTRHNIRDQKIGNMVTFDVIYDMSY